MKLTQRDKKLLFVLGILLILFVPYYFIVRPYSEKTIALENEAAELENRRNQLYELETRREEFEGGIKEAEKEQEKLLNCFPSELSQEGSLLFLYNTEQLIPITLSQVSFGELVREPEEGIKGMCASSQILYSVNYKNFKEFLAYVQNYKDRMVISSLSAVYTGELDLVTGSLTLEQYAIAGEERKPVRLVKPSISEGSSNIFMQASGIASVQEEAADFFLMLSRPKAEVDSVIFGKTKDSSEKTYLTSKENKLQEAAISFKGKEGSYIANYQIGDVKYATDGTGISFDKEGNIRLEILSSPRTEKEDQVEVRLEIINKTDKTVYVEVKNDDADRPRVTVTGKTGEVILR